jgi:integrase
MNSIALIQESAAAAYLGALAPGSRGVQVKALDEMAYMLSGGQHTAYSFPWGALRFQHTTTLRSALAAKFAPATTNRYLAALRGTLKAAWKMKQMGAEDYQHAVDVRGVPCETVKSGRMLEQEELRALMCACDGDSPLQRRDLAVMWVLRETGLRRSEMVKLDVADLERDILVVRHGKGNKARRQPIHRACAPVNRWLQVRGLLPGPLFLPLLKNGATVMRRLSADSLYKMCLRLAGVADVPTFSPHDLRRTFVSMLLDAGEDVSTVQALAGHSNVNTTVGYDRRPEARKAEAIARMSA